MQLQKGFDPIVSGLNWPDEWGLEGRIGERKKFFMQLRERCVV